MDSKAELAAKMADIRIAWEAAETARKAWAAAARIHMITKTPEALADAAVKAEALEKAQKAYKTAQEA